MTLPKLPSCITATRLSVRQTRLLVLFSKKPNFFTRLLEFL